MKNIRITTISLLLLLVCAGNLPANARENKATISGVGTVNSDTEYTYRILKARREAAFGKAEVPCATATVKVLPEKFREQNVQTTVAQPEAVKKLRVPTVEAELAHAIVSQHPAGIPPSERPDHSFKASFNEYSVYTGAWHAMGAGSSGFWTLSEMTHWLTRLEDAENLGYGPTVRTDYGGTKGGTWHWGYVAPGVNLDYYRAFTPSDDILVKMRMLYRFGITDNSRSGFMPGAYLQFTHSLNSRDVIIITADGQYFPKDSYLAFAAMGEHRFTPDFLGKGGGVLSFNISDGKPIIGVGPQIVLGYRNFSLSASSIFAAGGPFIGICLGYNVSDNLRKFDADRREEAVKWKGGITTASASEELKVEKSSDGSYRTLPGAKEDVVTIAKMPLDQE